MKNTILLVLLTSLSLSLFSCTSQKSKLSPITLNTHSAVTPVPRQDQWWLDRHNAILERVKKGNTELIMIGDSITHGWENDGKEIWEKYYAKYNALNLGFSGDGTQHVLWRLYNGEINGISPKLAIVMIGTNNSAHNPSEETSEGIIAIVQKLRHDLPQTKILLLAIFPHTENPDNPRRAINAKTSQLASVVADNKWVFYLDINKSFLDSNGVLPKDVMPDFLHPNANGYRIWAESMEPAINRILKN